MPTDTLTEAITHPPFPAGGVPLLGTLSDRLLARQLGVPWTAVTAERKRRRIAPARSGRRLKDPADKRSVRLQALVTPDTLARVDAARGSVSRSDWTATAVLAALAVEPAS
jgi:hypothetical protein